MALYERTDHNKIMIVDVDREWKHNARLTE